MNHDTVRHPWLIYRHYIFRVTTYKQLGTDIFPNSKSALGNLDEIDISILTECLENEDYIEEPDEPWIWDQLFAQLAVKISTEAKSTPVEYKN